MQDSKPSETKYEYLDTANWAKLSAYLWLRGKFLSDFERNPVQAIAEAQSSSDPADKIELNYKVKKDKDNNCYKPLTKLLLIPKNPGYSADDLFKAIRGEVAIVPMCSWNLHGVSSAAG